MVGAGDVVGTHDVGWQTGAAASAMRDAGCGMRNNAGSLNGESSGL